MKKSLALLLVFAHAPAQTPAPEADSEEDVARITANLVQFDAVVTDKHGRYVADLRPEDFKVFVDGRRLESRHGLRFTVCGSLLVTVHG